MADELGLSGSVALITGASRGIGAACAQALSGAGTKVALVGRSREAIEALAEELSSGSAATSLPIVLDVSDAQGVEAAVASTVAELGGLDVLVNAAGTTARAPALELELEEWDRVLDVNLKATFTMSRAAAGAMIERGGGSIVNIASLSSSFGIRRAAAYGASKGGVAQLTKALALEWGGQGIRVNAVAPGYIETELTQSLIEDRDRYRSVESRIPLGRWGTPEDVAGAVLMVCSPLARYVSGQVIYVDGGYTADG
jgi:NAD(P)-dependent dehydrogenase (short-subunit alcohol dehydrogenase family)